VTGGEVFVSDGRNGRIQKLTTDGTYLTSFTLPATPPAHSAIAVAVASDGTVYVTDYAGDRVHAWRQPR